MPRADCEAAFRSAAAADGIELIRAKVPWINQRGHLGLPPEAAAAQLVLEKIFSALGGTGSEQAAKKPTPLPGDFLHQESGVFIEIDEHQHFTSYRLAALGLYPEDTPLGFDLTQYRDLCKKWSPQADRYRASKEAVGFGPGGRQRQRAYYDALRDLVTPAMGHPPVIRVAAPERDGIAAYASTRERLLRAVSDPRTVGGPA